MITTQFRNRFNHVSAEDSLNLKERIKEPDLQWMDSYAIFPVRGPASALSG